MPNMSEVISNVEDDIIDNAGTTGQEIVDRLNYKNHKIKHAINSLYEDELITAPTIPLVETIVNRLANESTNIFESGNIFVTPLQVKVGVDITHVGLYIVTADGNVRVKVYSDNNGVPDELLGESNNTLINSTGVKFIALITPITTTAETIWVGFETDSDLLEVTASEEQITKSVPHVYGAGIDPIDDITVENPDGLIFNESFTPKINIKTTVDILPRWYIATWTHV